MRDASSAPGRNVYTVSRLNREARLLLESGFPLLWVEGELSNLARPASGHLYFTLKDAAAQVRCAMFRNRNVHLAFTPEDGMHVLVRARVSLYEGRGEFQLVVEHMEEAGDGALRRAFEQLKQRLAAEGLFDSARKRPIPTLPRRIGVVTSPSGAAIRDILSVLGRRFPAIPVLIYPVPVQGEGAAAEIARALRTAAARRECDVLILARGGGSLEDLWAFNEEVVARAVADCPIPVVTGIGHEIDFTIADFAADRRAPTPSAAAELVSPDRADWLKRLAALGERLSTLMARRLAEREQALTWLARRLDQQHPGSRLRQAYLRLDELDLRLRNAQRVHLRHLGARLETLSARLQRHAPLHGLQALNTRAEHLAHRLRRALEQRLEQARQRLAAAGRALDTVSPLATLGRGYAIVTRLPDRAVVYRADQVSPGERVEARFARGRLLCRVEESREK